MASRFNDDGVAALYQAMKPRLAELGLDLAEGTLPAVNTRFSTHQAPIVPAARTRCTGRDHRHRPRLQEAGPRAGRALAREVQQLRGTARMLKEANADKVNAHSRGDRTLAEQREGRLHPDAKKLRAMWPDMRKAYAGDEYVVKIRDKEIRTNLVHTTLSGTKIRKVALPPVRGPRRDPEVADAGQRAGQLSVHRGRVRVQARGRGPDADVRRRRRCVPYQPPLQARLRRPAGQAAVHRVRLGHAVRRRPGAAPRHIRQGRQLGRQHRHARGHEGAVLGLRPAMRVPPPRCR